jgi:hypothetical protein
MSFPPAAHNALVTTLDGAALKPPSLILSHTMFFFLADRKMFFKRERERP